MTGVELLAAGITPRAVELVETLTRRKGEDYAQFIERVSHDRDALLIKLADLEDNMRDLDEGSLKDKYRIAHLYLIEVLAQAAVAV